MGIMVRSGLTAAFSLAPGPGFMGRTTSTAMLTITWIIVGDTMAASRIAANIPPIIALSSMGRRCMMRVATKRRTGIGNPDRRWNDNEARELAASGPHLFHGVAAVAVDRFLFDIEQIFDWRRGRDSIAQPTFSVLLPNI
jgi:hypothetical protein